MMASKSRTKVLMICLFVFCPRLSHGAEQMASRPPVVAPAAKFSVDVHLGTTRILQDGRPLESGLFFVNLLRNRPKNTAIMAIEIDEAARRNVNIIIFHCSLPWADGDEKPNYAVIDTWCDAALAANPNALLLPRVMTTDVTKRWREENPGELNLFNTGKTSDCPSFHSRKWRTEAAQQLKDMVVHLEGKYGGHIIGYQPHGVAPTGEWVSENLLLGVITSFEPCVVVPFREFLARKYGGKDEELCAAWGKSGLKINQALPPTAEERLRRGPPAFRELPAEQNVVDFLDFRSEEMADAMLLMCKSIKEVAPEKLCLVFFMGGGGGFWFPYVGMQESGRLWGTKALNSPYVDGVCSPVTYMDRYAGGTGFTAHAVDSSPLYGKLSFFEDDLRTHLSTSDSLEATINRNRASASREETEGCLTRNMGQYISHGLNFWWMDLWGEGWFRGEQMWDFLDKLKKAHVKSQLGEKEYVRPEIAVFTDLRSQLYLRAHSQAWISMFLRQSLGKVGAPIGFYYLDDLLSEKVRPAKLNLVINAFALDDGQIATLNKIGEGEHTFLWFWAPGLICNNRLDDANIARATGIAVTASDRSDLGIIHFPQHEENFNPKHEGLHPSFLVTDPSVTPLAEYVSGGVAVAEKKIGAATHVYSGVLTLPSWFLRDLARKAGVHIYNNQDDVIAAGHGYVMIHAASNGQKTLSLPAQCTLKDAVTSETFGPATDFTFLMVLGQSRLLEILPTDAR